MTMNQLAGSWGALAGLKVLDFTRALAGPFCTQLLADMGATVIKVEGLEGDMTRPIGPFHPSDEQHRHSGYFHSVNRNKHGIAVNLKTEAGRQIIFDMIDEADIVVENFRAGVMERFGLSYEELSARNDRLIYAALRGFGDPRTGESPYVNWPALDVVGQAMGGINSVTGPGPGQPTKVGPGVGDTIPGMFLALGILGAVVNRYQTGKGQFLDVSMVDCILAISERIVYQRSFGKTIPGPVGNHQPNGGPFGIFPAKDGHVAIGASPQHFFEILCRGIGAEELLEGRYKDVPGRRKYRAELVEDLSVYTARLTKAEFVDRLGGKIPLGPVYDIGDIAADPHFAVREMLPELELEGISEPVSIAGVPIKMTRTPGAVHSPGPDLGGDTRAVLESIGYSPEKIADLLAEGAIACDGGNGAGTASLF
jgi:crotonobetainyl-CoA:carnitine CoA-transferase CaiB-like acyl-CoA transferase